MKDNELKVKWSKKERDLEIFYPTKPDGNLAYSYICAKNLNYNGGEMKSFIQELEDRGYDLTTLKFSIKKK